MALPGLRPAEERATRVPSAPPRRSPVQAAPRPLEAPVPGHSRVKRASAGYGGYVSERRPNEDDDRPPICPACGVTMGLVISKRGEQRYVCLECGFADDGGSRAT